MVEDSSGKRQGETRISKRGRKRLRYLLFEVALSLVGKNDEFRELHYYYTHRAENPLKKKQSLIAIACKFLRAVYKILTTGADLVERPVFYQGRGRVKGSYTRIGDSDEPMTEYEVYSYEAYKKISR